MRCPTISSSFTDSRFDSETLLKGAYIEVPFVIPAIRALSAIVSSLTSFEK